MNYYEPLVLKDSAGKGTGIYHMTCRTGFNNTSPVGYCIDHNCDHKTPEEASDCYRRFCIEKQNGMVAGFPMESPIKWGTVLYIISSH